MDHSLQASTRQGQSLVSRQPLPWPVPGVQIYRGDSVQRCQQKKKKEKRGVGQVPFPPLSLSLFSALFFSRSRQTPLSERLDQASLQGTLQAYYTRQVEKTHSLVGRNLDNLYKHAVSIFFLSLIEKNQYFGKHLFYKTRTDYAGEKLVLGLRI